MNGWGWIQVEKPQAFAVAATQLFFLLYEVLSTWAKAQPHNALHQGEVTKDELKDRVAEYQPTCFLWCTASYAFPFHSHSWCGPAPWPSSPHAQVASLWLFVPPWPANKQRHCSWARSVALLKAAQTSSSHLEERVLHFPLLESLLELPNVPPLVQVLLLDEAGLQLPILLHTHDLPLALLLFAPPRVHLDVPLFVRRTEILSQNQTKCPEL